MSVYITVPDPIVVKTSDKSAVMELVSERDPVTGRALKSKPFVMSLPELIAEYYVNDETFVGGPKQVIVGTEIIEACSNEDGTFKASGEVIQLTDDQHRLLKGAVESGAVVKSWGGNILRQLVPLGNAILSATDRDPRKST